jgi:hypothetical protein
MKKRISLVFIFFAGVMVLSAQSVHPDIDYYPLHIGNYWEYSNNQSVLVEKDTLLLNGHLYKKLITKHILSGNVIGISYERIDSLTAQVYKYSSFCNQEILIDSLAAFPDNLFQAMRFSGEPPCIGKSYCMFYYADSIVLGINTEIKGFRGSYATDLPQYNLAKGFGIERMYGYIFFLKLEYAIIDGISYGTPVNVKYENKTPSEFILYNNYPNPFNSNTIISFNIPEPSFIELNIYDVLGSIINLVHGYYDVGFYEVPFNIDELSSGFYIYQLRAKNFISSKKMLLLK